MTTSCGAPADGQGGDDIVVGGPGNDILWGSESSDILRGHAGADVLENGLGADILDGGAHNGLVGTVWGEVAAYTKSAAGVTIW